MQAGSGGLHCGVDGRQMPLLQNWLSAHFTPAQAVACEPVPGTSQTPPLQRPSPQSESTLQGFPCGETEQESSSGSHPTCCLSTHADASSAMARQMAPLPIRHLPNRCGQGGDGASGVQATMESVVIARTCECRL